MNALDIIPLHYWIRTRFGSFFSASFVFYILTNLGYLGCAIAYAAQKTEFPLEVYSKSFFLLLVWGMYLAIYEIGYFINDFWSLKREQDRGFNLAKTVPNAPSKIIFSLAVVSRAIFASFSFVCLDLFVDEFTFNYTAIAILFISAVFLTHNAIFYPYRAITFFLLYLARYLLVLPFIHHQLDLLVIFALASSPALGYALTYAIRKRVVPIDLIWIQCSSSFILRATSLFLLINVVISALISNTNITLLLILLSYCILLDLLFVISRFIFGIIESFGKNHEGYHVHSSFSHDCKLSPKTVNNQAYRRDLLKVYVTDHADTFSVKKYEGLKRCFSNLNNPKSCQFVVGLEYPILGQHFLAINLKEYLEIDRKNINELQRLKKSCDSLVWAHPLFAVKRIVFDREYRKKLIVMMALVDGLEWINLKSVRGYGCFWRHLLICFIAVALFGKKLLIIGLDAHTLEDWENQPLVLKLIRFFYNSKPLKQLNQFYANAE